MEAKRYLSAERMTQDDFGVAFTNKPGEVIYDAKTKRGPWATMTQQSFLIHGHGMLGLGFGQKYTRQANGELHKTGG